MMIIFGQIFLSRASIGKANFSEDAEVRSNRKLFFESSRIVEIEPFGAEKFESANEFFRADFRFL